MPVSLQGRSTGAWAKVPLAAAGCLLSPISLVFLFQVSYSWIGAQREKQGHHSGCQDRLYLHGRSRHWSGAPGCPGSHLWAQVPGVRAGSGGSPEGSADQTQEGVK